MTMKTLLAAAGLMIAATTLPTAADAQHGPGRGDHGGGVQGGDRGHGGDFHGGFRGGGHRDGGFRDHGYRHGYGHGYDRCAWRHRHHRRCH